MIDEDKRFSVSTLIRLCGEIFSADELNKADSQLRRLRAIGLNREEELTRRVASDFRRTAPLGLEFAASMAELRTAYEGWRSPALAATRWGPYQQAPTQYHSALP